MYYMKTLSACVWPYRKPETFLPYLGPIDLARPMQILMHYLIETLRIALKSVEEDLHDLFVRWFKCHNAKKGEENLNGIVF